LPIAGAELAQVMEFDANDGKGNVKLGECAQHFPQVGLHHRLIGQSGQVVQAASLFQAAVVRVWTAYDELTFKGLDEADAGAMFIAQGDCPGMYWSALSGLVVNEAHRLDGPGIVQGCRHGAFAGAHFTTDLVAMLKNVVGAGMSEDIDAGVPGDLFCVVAPEDNFLL